MELVEQVKMLWDKVPLLNYRVLPPILGDVGDLQETTLTQIACLKQQVETVTDYLHTLILDHKPSSLTQVTLSEQWWFMQTGERRALYYPTTNNFCYDNQGATNFTDAQKWVDSVAPMVRYVHGLLSLSELELGWVLTRRNVQTSQSELRRLYTTMSIIEETSYIHANLTAHILITNHEGNMFVEPHRVIEAIQAAQLP